MASISSVTNPETQTSSTSITDICNILNIHFPDIGPCMDAGIDATSQNFLQYLPSLPNSFCNTDITPDKVLLKLRLLDRKNSAGPENNPIKFTKMISTIVAPYLSELCNLCYKLGVFPSNIEHAKIVPLHKSGPTHSPINYRPISIVFCQNN